MTQPAPEKTEVVALITEVIAINIAAEAAQNSLLNSVTVEEAELCISVLSDHVLEIEAERHRNADKYDDGQIVIEEHAQKLRNEFMGKLHDLVTQRELLQGATPEEAEAVANARNRNIFDEFTKKRDNIYASDD